MQAARHKAATAAKARPTPVAPVVQRAPTSSILLHSVNKVSAPSDPTEREASATAKRIMRLAAPEGTGGTAVPRQGVVRGFLSPYVARFAKTQGLIGRSAAHGLARKGEGQPDVASSVSADIQNSVASGSPLPLSVRRFMEPRFGADFRDVRVHTGESAAGLNRTLSAQAFTVGNQIFFGRDRFRPETGEGRELIAHELTHTIQQGAAVQRSEDVAVTGRAPTMVQRLGISDALDYFADKANIIPGYRMLTVILGVNPINMGRVERNAANILRAVVELLPGGYLITQALDNYGVFDKVGAWVEQQIRSLGMSGAMFRQALDKFLDSLSWTDIFHLGDVWDRAKRIFTEPIGRLIDFGKGLVVGILKFIKDAILRPLAKLAEGTRGYDLLKAVLGEDPITGEPVPRTADTLIGGFMKLIGQEEVWNNLKRANAVARAWAWFQGAMSSLIGFVRQIPTLFISALQSLEIADIVLLPRAFAKVAGVFGSFFGRFFSWAGQQVLTLLQIIFEVLAPAAMPYIRKAAGAFRKIIGDPIGFIGNLVKAGIQGFKQFGTNFLTHLRTSLIGWLTGTLSGANIYIPQAFELKEIVKFVLSVLGLTWQNIRQKLVKVIGETAVTVLEKGFDVVVALVTEGPAAAWEKIKENISNLKDMVMEQIMTFVRDRIVQAAITKLVTSLNPAGAFIQAIIAIYNTIMFFVERLRQIAQVVASFIDSISAIADGVITAAANRVEKTMAGLLTLVISFLARLVGLGKVSDAVVNIVNKIRAPIDKAIDKVIEWIVATARKLKKLVTGEGRAAPEGGVYALARRSLVNRLGSRASVARAKAAAEEVRKEFAPQGLRSLDVRWSDKAKAYVFDAAASPGVEIVCLRPGGRYVTLYAQIAFEGSPVEGIGETFHAESRESLALTEGQPIARPTPPREPPGLSARDPRGHRKQALVVVKPPAGSTVLEVAAWNAGGPIEGSAVSHAETQFADWITGNQRDATWRGRVREVDIHLSHSPCDHCAPNLEFVANMLRKATKLAIVWDALYVDPHGERSTSAAGLGRLSKWTLHGEMPAGREPTTPPREVVPLP
jgi:hypothetical protein